MGLLLRDGHQASGGTRIGSAVSAALLTWVRLVGRSIGHPRGVYAAAGEIVRCSGLVKPAAGAVRVRFRAIVGARQRTTGSPLFLRPSNAALDPSIALQAKSIGPSSNIVSNER